MQDAFSRRIGGAWLCASIMLNFPLPTQAVTPERVEEVARRGAEVMPFDLEQTTHIFTRQQRGGLQQVIVKESAGQAQINLIRRHLSKIAEEFARGDFSDPERIHGASMPGLAELRNARSGQLRVQYRELPNGAEIEYISDDPMLINAIHRWFDAQVAEHGRHAMPGHSHDMMHP